MHIWIAAVIIGGVSFGGLITDGARQVTGFNFPQAIHNYLGKENVDVWNKAYLFYQQIKTDPEAALQVEVDRKELEFLLEEFKDKEGIVNPDTVEVRRVCIFMLGQDDSRVVHETLYAALSDPDSDTKLIAAISLSMRNNREAVSLLGKAAFENEGPVQQAAILSLSNAGSSEATEFILKNLSDDLHPGIRLAAAETLSYRANLPEVTEALLGSLKSDPLPEVRVQAAYNLAGIESDQVNDALVSALKDTDSLVKRAAILAVTPQADSDTMKLIRTFLSDEDPSIRQAAVLSVGSRLNGYSTDIITIMKKISDEDIGVRAAVVSVLGDNLDRFPSLENSLLSVVKNESQPVEIRQDALLSLSKIDAPEIKSLLIDNLNSDDWQMRQSAALGLGNFEGDEIPGLLEPLTRDSSWQVREASAASLGNFDQSEIIGYLEPLLSDGNLGVRENAVCSLGRINEPEVIELLEPLLEDDNVSIRQATALSLGDRLESYLQLIDPFINNLKIEDDPYTRYVFAAALQTIPGNPKVALESEAINDSLIPGLSIGGWEKTHPETGIEIGYSNIAGPISHTFIVVTYQNDSRVISFDTANKPLGFLLPSSEGKYFDEITDKQPMIYHTLTTDPEETKRLYDLAPILHKSNSLYNLFDIQLFGRNCYGGRNSALEKAGVSEMPHDSLLTPLGENYFSRYVSMDYSDIYYSYSLKMQQSVVYFDPGTKTIETHSVVNYNTIVQDPEISNYNYSLNLPSSDFNSWNSSNFRSFPGSSSLSGSNYPSYNYVVPPATQYVIPPSINNYVVPPSINNYVVPSIPYNPPTFNIPQSNTPGFSNWP
jgi:HEAT repeat protein